MRNAAKLRDIIDDEGWIPVLKELSAYAGDVFGNRSEYDSLAGCIKAAIGKAENLVIRLMGSLPCKEPKGNA